MGRASGRTRRRRTRRRRLAERWPKVGGIFLVLRLGVVLSGLTSFLAIKREPVCIWGEFARMHCLELTKFPGGQLALMRFAGHLDAAHGRDLPSLLLLSCSTSHGQHAADWSRAPVPRLKHEASRCPPARSLRHSDNEICQGHCHGQILAAAPSACVRPDLERGRGLELLVGWLESSPPLPMMMMMMMIKPFRTSTQF